jgi:TolA-binding protein
MIKWMGRVLVLAGLMTMTAEANSMADRTPVLDVPPSAEREADAAVSRPAAKPFAEMTVDEKLDELMRRVDQLFRMVDPDNRRDERRLENRLRNLENEVSQLRNEIRRLETQQRR